MTASDHAVHVVTRNIVPVHESGIRSVVDNDDVSRLNRRVVFNGHVLGAVDDGQESAIASESWTIDVVKQVVGDPHTAKTRVSWRWWFVPAEQENSGADVTDDVIYKLNVFNDCREAGIARARCEYDRSSSLSVGPVVFKNVADNKYMVLVLALYCMTALVSLKSSENSSSLCVNCLSSLLTRC